jgi:hypothetical protein
VPLASCGERVANEIEASERAFDTRMKATIDNNGHLMQRSKSLHDGVDVSVASSTLDSVLLGTALSDVPKFNIDNDVDRIVRVR